VKRILFYFKGSDVKWYKGTSEWSIKPSKFFQPKSDGTKHQLFILEAYAEDEGLYKCVVSNPVGTTATTATLKVDRMYYRFLLKIIIKILF
jgi:hypothetical protein